MNAKQITAVLAVVAILAAGVVGLGYAYTATTENASNTSDIAYIKLTDTTTSTAYQAHFQMQTLDSKTTNGTNYSYKLTSESIDVSSGTSKNLQALGTITLTIDSTEALATTPNFGLTIKASANTVMVENTGLIGEVTTQGSEVYPFYIKTQVGSDNATFTPCLSSQLTAGIKVIDGAAFDNSKSTTVTITIYGQAAEDYVQISTLNQIFTSTAFTFVATPEESS